LDYSKSSFSLEEELVPLEMEKELDGVQDSAKPRLINNDKQMVLPKVQGVQD
jgi:hypothetical protein